MAVKPADMNECSRKAKCCDGPNAGVAYSTGAPCYSGGSFDSETCECEYNGVGVFLTSSTGNLFLSDGEQDPQPRLMTLNSYFDPEGRWIEEKFSMTSTTSWLANKCSAGSNVYDSECINQQGVFTATKTTTCSGGGASWADYVKVFYADGQYDRFEFSGGNFRSVAGGQCTAPVGTTAAVTIQIRELGPPA